jgi:hypothetical protein
MQAMQIDGLVCLMCRLLARKKDILNELCILFLCIAGVGQPRYQIERKDSHAVRHNHDQNKHKTNPLSYTTPLSPHRLFPCTNADPKSIVVRYRSRVVYYEGNPAIAKQKQIQAERSQEIMTCDPGIKNHARKTRIHVLQRENGRESVKQQEPETHGPL